MPVNPISTNILDLLNSSPVISKTQETGTSFADIFSEALNTASVTDTNDKLSALGLLTGASDDFSGMLLDAQKAEISLNLALQMRNKILEAYNDLIKMQI